MTWASAVFRIVLVFVAVVVAGLYGLYLASPIAFGVAVGIVIMVLLLALLLPLLGMFVRLVNGRGVRDTSPASPAQDVQPRALPAGTPPPVYVDSSGTWQVETPAALPAPRYDA
jgi:hypothetical protein